MNKESIDELYARKRELGYLYNFYKERISLIQRLIDEKEGVLKQNE